MLFQKIFLSPHTELLWLGRLGSPPTFWNFQMFSFIISFKDFGKWDTPPPSPPPPPLGFSNDLLLGMYGYFLPPQIQKGINLASFQEIVAFSSFWTCTIVNILPRSPWNFLSSKNLTGHFNHVTSKKKLFCKRFYFSLYIFTSTIWNQIEEIICDCEYSPKYQAGDHDKVFPQRLQGQHMVDFHTMCLEGCQGCSSFQNQSLKQRERERDHQMLWFRYKWVI